MRKGQSPLFEHFLCKLRPEECCVLRVFLLTFYHFLCYSVMIPDSMTSIGQAAFIGCQGLTLPLSYRFGAADYMGRDPASGQIITRL